MTAIGTTYGYVCDRWGVYRSAYATGAQIGQGTDLTLSDLPFSEARLYTYGRVGRVAGNTSTNTVYLAYGFESIDSKIYIGQKITLSFYCRMGASFSGSSLTAQILTGTGTDEGIARGANISGATGYSGLTTPISTNWIKKYVTVTLNNSHNQLAINFFYSPINTTNAGSSDYFDITGIQLEKGAVATPFEVRPFSVELQLCQRYYEVGPRAYYTYGTAYGGGYANFISYKVSKRLSGTVTVYDDINNANKVRGYGPSSSFVDNVASGIENSSIAGFSVLATPGYGFLSLYWIASSEL
jgi:hypothetical protein